MDSYYKIITIIAIVILIICLILVGIVISKSSKKSIFPPNVSKCPDFYRYEDGVCNSIRTTGVTYTGSCDIIDFSDSKYSNPGMGPTSGMCEKKKKADSCNITWDGITNNTEVCYSINS